MENKHGESQSEAEHPHHQKHVLHVGLPDGFWPVNNGLVPVDGYRNDSQRRHKDVKSLQDGNQFTKHFSQRPMGQQKPHRRQRNAEKTCQNVGEGEVKDEHTSAGFDLGLPDDYVDKQGVSEEAKQYDQSK